MLKLIPVLLAVVYGLALYRFSAWRTAKQLDAKSTELADPNLKKLTDRMAAALDLDRIRVNIYEVAPINGLAAPDGRIFITRGFYDKYKSGDVTGEELSSVIAHELGHIALGHSRRRMIDFSGQNAARLGLVAVFRFIPVVGPLIGPFMANGLIRLLAAGLSRKDEYEADAYASALLTKSGIGTAPQISLFEKLDALAGATRSAPAWLLSHPKTSDRIAAIAANTQKWSPEG